MIDPVTQVEQLIEEGSYDAARLLLVEEPAISNTRRARLVARLTESAWVQQESDARLERDRLFHVSGHATD